MQGLMGGSAAQPYPTHQKTCSSADPAGGEVPGGEGHGYKLFEPKPKSRSATNKLAGKSENKSSKRSLLFAYVSARSRPCSRTRPDPEAVNGKARHSIGRLSHSSRRRPKLCPSRRPRCPPRCLLQNMRGPTHRGRSRQQWSRAACAL